MLKEDLRSGSPSIRFLFERNPSSHANGDELINALPGSVSIVSPNTGCDDDTQGRSGFTRAVNTERPWFQSDPRLQCPDWRCHRHGPSHSKLYRHAGDERPGSSRHPRHFSVFDQQNNPPTKWPGVLFCCREKRKERSFVSGTDKSVRWIVRITDVINVSPYLRI